MRANMSTVRFGVSDPVSLAYPTAQDVKSTGTLVSLLKEKGFYEDETGRQLREKVLGKLNEIVTEWIRRVLRQKGFSEEAVRAASAGAKIYTSGSFRLGIHGQDADIDTLCLGPRSVDISDFFGVLAPMLREREECSKLVSVTEAYVPVIKLEFSGVDIDLLFARLASNTIPAQLDLTDDALLASMDERSIRSLNGARVAVAMLNLVPSPEQFRIVARAVKLWARSRGVYANVLGYPGGLAWTIMVARICQLYPNAEASVIFLRFFTIYARWKWPQPVILRNIQEGALPSWNPAVVPKDRRDLMPVITPVYPCMCSTYNISKSTKYKVQQEMERAVEVAAKLEAATLQLGDDGQPKAIDWPPLLEPYQFFLDAQYKAFVRVDAWGQSEEELQPWKGWVESQLRKIIPNLEFAPHIRYAVPRPGTLVDPTRKERQHNECWWLGLVMDPVLKQPDGSRGKIDLQRAVQDWLTNVNDNFKGKTDTMGVGVSVVLPKDLPVWVFPDGVRPVKPKRRVSAAPAKDATTTTTTTTAAVGATVAGSVAPPPSATPTAPPPTSQVVIDTIAPDNPVPPPPADPEAERGDEDAANSRKRERPAELITAAPPEVLKKVRELDDDEHGENGTSAQPAAAGGPRGITIRLARMAE